ncbi:hypothetical protein HDR58_08755 [bacterium]|nr:hypothetical protein [bacterium]
MSMDLPKLNRPGLGGSFGASRNGSSRTKVASNLTNSSAATRTTSFSLSSKKRYNFTAGTGVNEAKERYKNNYQGIRASLNSGVTASRGGFGTSGLSFNSGIFTGGYSNGNSFINGLTMANMVGQTLFGGIEMLNQIGVLGGNKGVSSTPAVSNNSGNLNTAMNSLGNGPSSLSNISSGSVANAISNMENCQDSASLRGAIGSAESQLSELNGQTESLKSAADTANKNLKDLETTAKQKEKGVSEAKQGLTNAKNTVTAKTNMRDTKKLELEKADANFAAKSEALTQAKANTEAAQSALNEAKAMPDQVPDGNGGMKPNEAKQKAVADAQAKLNQAKEAEQAAEKAKAEAKEQSNVAKEQLEKAEGELEAAEKGVKDAEDEQKVAEENLKKVEGELKKAKQDVTDAKGAIETFKQHEQDVKGLTNKIAKQKERLTKLENEEIKNYQKYDGKAQDTLNKANELAGKVDQNGNGVVDTRSERRASKGIDGANGKAREALNNRNSLTANVDETFAAKKKKKQAPTVTINGEEFRKGTNPITGNTVYMRGTQIIDEETFNNATGVTA